MDTAQAAAGPGQQKPSSRKETAREGGGGGGKRSGDGRREYTSNPQSPELPESSQTGKQMIK